MTKQVVIGDLMNGGWKALEFKPFRDGVEIHHLLEGEPAIALLKYQPGARIPLHRHTGLETVLVISGEQRDERGTYPVGTMVANPEGSCHSVWSETGCVVLIQWTRPVVILEND